MALNYLKTCCWKQHIGHLKNMRYFPLTMRHHNDLLCRTDWPPRDIVFVESQEGTAQLQKCDHVPKPVQVTVPHVFGREALFVLPEVMNDKVKSGCNTVSDKLYSKVCTVNIKKNNVRKMTKTKDRCLSEFGACMTLPSTQISLLESFVQAQGFKGKSVTAPFLEPMTFLDGYMATQQMENDQRMNHERENRILRKCEKNSERDVMSCSAKNNESGTGISPQKDLPSAKQLGITQEKIIEQFGMFFKRMQNFDDYDMPNFVFVNNFFGKEKIYKGTQYHWILAGIKLRCHMRFVIVNISVTSALADVEEGTVKVYWQLVGVTQTYFLKKLWQSFGNYTNVVDNSEYYSGVSVFHINSEGKIYRHRVDRMDQIKEGKTVRQPEMAMA